jgi:hypothetical protein
MKKSCYFLLANFPLANSKWPVAGWLAVDIIDFIDTSSVPPALLLSTFGFQGSEAQKLNPRKNSVGFRLPSGAV